MAGKRSTPEQIIAKLRQVEVLTAQRRVPAERVARFEALPGWIWDPSGDRFAVWLAVLQTYVGREGHARVPVGHREGGIRLGSWAPSVAKRTVRGASAATRLPVSGRCPAGPGTRGPRG